MNVKVSTRVAPVEFSHVNPGRAKAMQPPPPQLISRASFNDAFTRTKQAVFRGRVISEASSAMRMVLRNAAASCICAWIANFLFSLGNPFAATSSRNQSAASLVMANLMWTNVLFYSIMLLTHATVLRPLRFLSNPDKRLTLWLCIKQLVMATYTYYLATVVLQICLGLVVGHVLPPNMRKYKLEFYIGTLVNHHYMVGMDIATRTIFKTRTCQGKEWLQRRREQQQQETNRSTCRALYWKAYGKGSSKLIPMFLASGAYIQVVSQTHLFNHGLKTFTFVAISTATKVLVQAAIKMYVVKHRVKDIRTMCALVGLPTVLIDTQVRIMLLCQQNYTFAATGVLAMAVVEIVIRGTKAALLSAELQRRYSTKLDRSSTLTTEIQPTNDALSTMPTLAIPASNTPFRLPAATQQRDVEQLRQVIYRFHAAEASADMHAGYIAIGCSASIWFFFSKNPHYDLGLRTTDNDSLSTLAPLLLIQVGVEVVADYLSCVLEAAAGVHFKALDKVGLFLALIFMTHAVLNVVMSAALYIE